MMNVLEKANEAWNAMAPLRHRRERYKRFTYGRQWDDVVTDPDTGCRMTERSLLSKGGRPPLTNNLIRQLLKSVIGRYRVFLNKESVSPTGDTAADDAARMLREELSVIYDEHELAELDCRLLEEFLISGVAVQRTGCDSHSRSRGFRLVENVWVPNFFIGATRDPRCDDAELIGQLHDFSPEEVVTRWGDGTRQGMTQLLAELRESSRSDYWRYGTSADYCTEFLRGPQGSVRVIEVWTKEFTDRLLVHDRERGEVRMLDASQEGALTLENHRRVSAGREPLGYRYDMERKWVGRWFLGDGRLIDTVRLSSGERHPYMVKMYPLIDGEVHSLVEDVIDQQKYVNRLINLLDRMMATAAKGALLFPVDSLPEGCDFEDIARQWSAPDGVVPYKSFVGDNPPKQMSTTIGDIGAKDLLKVEMDLFKEISGVSDALAGRNLSSKVGVERYALELENSSVSIRDLMDTFSSLIGRRDARLLNWSRREKTG